MTINLSPHKRLSKQWGFQFRQYLLAVLAPQVMPKVLARVALIYPNKVGLICEETQLTYAQIQTQSKHLAHKLLALGVTQGDWVAIMLPNCPEFVLSFLAIAQIGAVVVPVDIYYQPAEIEQLINETSISTFISDITYLNTVEAALKNCPCCKNLLVKGGLGQTHLNLEVVLQTPPKHKENTPSPKTKKPIKADDNLLYLYTSGTTGMPKGIMLTHKKALTIGRAWRQRYTLADSDKCLTMAPLFRSPALLGVLVAGVCYGLPMVISPRFEPEQVWARLCAEKVSFFHGCPFHFAVLASLPAPDSETLPPLKSCDSSGNKLAPWISKTFSRKFGIKINERYGTSEVGGICKNRRPLHNVAIKLINKKGIPIKGKGKIGEIVVKTPVMVNEYYQSPALTANAFKEGWFYTGDLGKFDQEGKLQILCRKKTIFLIAGKTVYADEVERALRRHPNVDKAKAIMTQSKPETPILKALVVLKAPCSTETLFRICHKKLPPHKVPSIIEIRDTLPQSWKAVIAGLEQAYPKWGES